MSSIYKFTVALLVPALFVVAFVSAAGCIATPQNVKIYQVGELLDNPVYDTPVYVIGTVSDLGAMNCMCFHLTSGGGTLEAWYGTMVEDDRSEWPNVDVSAIENGDEVVLYGELKSAGQYRQEGAFWIKEIQKIDS